MSRPSADWLVAFFTDFLMDAQNVGREQPHAARVAFDVQRRDRHVLIAVCVGQLTGTASLARPAAVDRKSRSRSDSSSRLTSIFLRPEQPVDRLPPRSRDVDPLPRVGAGHRKIERHECRVDRPLDLVGVDEPLGLLRLHDRRGQRRRPRPARTRRARTAVRRGFARRRTTRRSPAPQRVVRPSRGREVGAWPNLLAEVVCVPQRLGWDMERPLCPRSLGRRPSSVPSRDASLVRAADRLVRHQAVPARARAADRRPLRGPR